MIKKLKIQKVSSNSATKSKKVRKQEIRFWDERTFWHEIIYKSLTPTFGKPTEVSEK